MYSLSLLDPIVSSNSASPSTTPSPSHSTLQAISLGLSTERDPPPNSSPANSTLLSSTAKVATVHRGRTAYSSLSSLRTKPGRPDSIPTLSHSCSDKISMWNLLGLQGGLLSSFVERIPLESIVIGGVHCSNESERLKVMSEVTRGIGGRLEGFESGSEEFDLRMPCIHFTTQEFIHSREVVAARYKSSPSSCPESESHCLLIVIV
jgi:tRNA-specific adenosine deaminase 1